MTAARPWAYSAFRVEVRARRQLSPRFLRLTFGGPDLRYFAPWGADQRIKLVLPMADGSVPEFGLLDEPTPHPSEWYAKWRALPQDARNVLRTYTPAAIRPEAREIDVDFFLHTPEGPASAWAVDASIGESLVLTGPDVRMGFTGYGLHWKPGGARRFLLIADETAYPAARNILATLPADADIDLLIEVDDPADEILSRSTPAGVRVEVAQRGALEESGVERAARAWAARNGTRAAEDPRFFAWIAGEAGSTTRIRRMLTAEAGIPKDRVAFLGYWRTGGALVD